MPGSDLAAPAAAGCPSGLCAVSFHCVRPGGERRWIGGRGAARRGGSSRAAGAAGCIEAGAELIVRGSLGPPIARILT